jgi:hypothetical protein
MNLLGSLDTDFNPAVDTEASTAEMRQEYESVPIGEQAERVTDESTDSIAERDTVRNDSPRRDSRGIGAETDSTDRSVEPHMPRKLHSFTSKV